MASFIPSLPDMHARGMHALSQHNYMYVALITLMCPACVITTIIGIPFFEQITSREVKGTKTCDHAIINHVCSLGIAIYSPDDPKKQ